MVAYGHEFVNQDLPMRVLGLQASHLLLIHTNLGYGTILMVACTHQGCSASGGGGGRGGINQCVQSQLPRVLIGLILYLSVRKWLKNGQELNDMHLYKTHTERNIL
jgi:hypothetical protein